MKIVEVTAVAIVTIALIVFGIVETVKWNNQHKIERGIGNSAKAGVDNSPAKIYQMPYGYDNFAEKCDDRGNLIIVTANANATSFIQVVKGGCKE